MSGELELFSLERATFTPENSKPVLLNEIELGLSDDLEDYGDKIGIPISINSTKAGAIPDLKVGQRGILEFIDETERCYHNRIIHYLCEASVYSCDAANGRLVFIAESRDGITNPHASSAGPADASSPSPSPGMESPIHTHRASYQRI
jgi:hypothetical protein